MSWLQWNLFTLEMGEGTSTSKAKAGFCDNCTTPMVWHYLTDLATSAT